jgi:hypothetical protein
MMQKGFFARRRTEFLSFDAAENMNISSPSKTRLAQKGDFEKSRALLPKDAEHGYPPIRPW